MEAPEVNQLHLQIVEKLSRLDEGVSGINRRLDISNGRIAKLEDGQEGMKVQLAVSENLEAEEKEQRKWSNGLWKEFIKGAAGIAWVVIAGLALVVLQRTGVIDISVLNA